MQDKWLTRLFVEETIRVLGGPVNPEFREDQPYEYGYYNFILNGVRVIFYCEEDVLSGGCIADGRRVMVDVDIRDPKWTPESLALEIKSILISF